MTYRNICPKLADLITAAAAESHRQTHIHLYWALAGPWAQGSQYRHSPEGTQWDLRPVWKEFADNFVHPWVWQNQRPCRDTWKFNWVSFLPTPLGRWTLLLEASVIWAVYSGGLCPEGLTLRTPHCTEMQVKLSCEGLCVLTGGDV